jgi:LmbE family N-acetylglucosaminyl deacetylase
MKKESDLYILVLSNGGFDGLGKIRQKEMELASKYMGFKSEQIIDDPRIPDGPHLWDIDVVVELIKNHIISLKQN